MSITNVSVRNLVLASGLMALLLAAGATTRVNAQSVVTPETSSETNRPECRFSDRSLKGIYGFGYVGLAPQVSSPNSVSQYNPFTTGGMWNFHGDGTFDASATLVGGGDASPQEYSGTYSINPNGTGTADYTSSTGTHHRNLVIVNGGKTIEFIQTDGLVVGTMIKQ